MKSFALLFVVAFSVFAVGCGGETKKTKVEVKTPAGGTKVDVKTDGPEGGAKVEVKTEEKK